MSRTDQVTEDKLARSLVDGFSAFSRQMRSLALPDGMTRERLAIMSYLDEHGPVSVTELADFARVRAPTMSRMTSSLVEDGLARKQSQKSDGRGVLIALTAKGKRKFEEANKRSVEHLRQALGKLSKSQIAALSGLANAMESLGDR